ncbi:hypothetical protein BT93_L3389 [Corymbia citriodora subsp. variegata]|uniref:Uncharacterized protein n=1 Tax=Corymbia citriodora subsp. variegata TaxID=360336 RepID=A0A8T0CHR4_CORYI|nr:hypothetical protein BT93_L3389 [Corymbia citriodora subsp. variegata]KAF7847074.1 hypothetical protein BT93_L3389 [Corymbia citriodora subsp. variegata]
MAAASGIGVVGLTVTARPSSSKLPRSSPSRACMRMAISLDEKKRAFTLQKSEEAFSAAKELMPGGVNSPVRALKSVGDQPIVMASVKGSRVCVCACTVGILARCGCL